MSKIKVNTITNKNEDGPVELTSGASIPSGKSLTVLGDANFSGIVTATGYDGDGSQLTGLGGDPATIGQLYAIKTILATVYRS